MKLLLYCTKAKPYLHKTQCIFDNSPIEWQLLDYDHYKKDPYDAVFGTLVCDLDRVNGKIVAECDFEVEEIKWNTTNWVENFLTTKSMSEQELQKRSCITGFDLREYFDICYDSINDSIVGYAIHIKDLHIFDEPKELNSVRYKNHSVKSAPQNMMKVYDYSGEYYILISIRPEWLCKILNGEKTIEVRKKVLKEMLK